VLACAAADVTEVEGMLKEGRRMDDNDRAAGPSRKGAVWLALLFAMTFPAVRQAWGYFLALAGAGTGVNQVLQWAYVGGKVVQFSFPVVFLALGGCPWPRPLRPQRTGLGLGPAFGLLVTMLMLGVYFVALRQSPLMTNTPGQIRHRLEQFGMDTKARYLALAAFIVTTHSLLEEYYWRWFVFGQLRRVLPRPAAVALSSLAFMAHHVIILYVYLPGRFWTLAAPFSLAVAAGGAVWAWLYDRAGTLYPSWLSHLLVDAALFIIGWDLLWPPGG
jgi:membrane protease YdiL (CAAX protease family)